VEGGVARITRLIETAAAALALVGGAGIVAMLLHVFADVLSRHIFNEALPATVEIVSRYYMVAAAFLPLAWVERNRSMISVEILTGMVSPQLVRVSDVAVLLLSAVIYAVLVYASLRAAIPHFERGAFIISLSTSVPIWQTYFILPAAFAMAMVVTLARAVSLILGSDDSSAHQSPPGREDSRQPS
jgi:TRAP-type C4-dicarboxylate transport system permease small subunit